MQKLRVNLTLSFLAGIHGIIGTSATVTVLFTVWQPSLQSDWFAGGNRFNPLQNGCDLLFHLLHISVIWSGYLLQRYFVHLYIPSFSLITEANFGPVLIHILQENLNRSTEMIRRGGRLFKLNDKVMQIKNNYDKEVFNGDIGTVSKVNANDQEMTVVFDGRAVQYETVDMDELVLAYATTIHKSQGSEYPIVVIPVSMSHYIMLQRNLIYTGVTRAKKICVLVGTEKALRYAVRNMVVQNRNTKLKERLQALPAV